MQHVKKIQQRLNSIGKNKLNDTSTYIVASLLVFLASFGATVYYWYGLRQTTQEEFTKTATREIAATEQAIGSRLQTYGDILIGGVALFKASENVTREEWDIFVSSYEVQSRYPGVQGFGFGEYVSSNDLQRHIDMVRASGISDYTVSPLKEEGEYMPVVYLSPFSEQRQRALGFDMLSEEMRRNAILLARDSGKPASTGKVFLVYDRSGRASQEPGFIIYIPLYRDNVPLDTVEQRRAALIGVVYAPFRANELLRGIFGSTGNENLGMRIYDGDTKTEEALMYESDNFASISEQLGALHEEKTVSVSQHEWTITYLVSPNIIPGSEQKARWSTLGGGILASIFFAGLVYYLLINRARKLMHAKQQEVQTAKDDLLSLASHQLRTPATVVKQYVGMLLQGYGGEITRQQRTMLESAYLSNERQLQIINQILYVARIDAGQIKLQKEDINITTLVKLVIKEHSGSVKDRKQKITSKLPQKPVHIVADRHYLHMALDNLVSNASKYTPEGGRINITLTSNKATVDISVSDTGVGIAQEELGSAFEKFTRLENALSSDVGGSGIGLYLVKQIAELHNGEVDAKPNDPQGTSFILRLPRK